MVGIGRTETATVVRHTDHTRYGYDPVRSHTHTVGHAATATCSRTALITGAMLHGMGCRRFSFALPPCADSLYGTAMQHSVQPWLCRTRLLTRACSSRGSMCPKASSSVHLKDRPNRAGAGRDLRSEARASVVRHKVRQEVVPASIELLPSVMYATIAHGWMRC